MIYAAALPIEEYKVEIEGQEFGLYPRYKDQPSVLALIAIATPLFYDYEGCRPPMKRRVDLGEELDVHLQTLKSYISGRTVEDLLTNLTPLEFFQYTEVSDISNLPINTRFFRGDSAALQFVIAARAATWGMHFRGKLSSAGKVVQVSFRGLDVPKHLQEAHYKLKEELKYGW